MKMKGKCIWNHMKPQYFSDKTHVNPCSQWAIEPLQSIAPSSPKFPGWIPSRSATNCAVPNSNSFRGLGQPWHPVANCGLWPGDYEKKRTASDHLSFWKNDWYIFWDIMLLNSCHAWTTLCSQIGRLWSSHKQVKLLGTIEQSWALLLDTRQNVALFFPFSVRSLDIHMESLWTPSFQKVGTMAPWTCPSQLVYFILKDSKGWWFDLSQKHIFRWFGSSSYFSNWKWKMFQNSWNCWLDNDDVGL